MLVQVQSWAPPTKNGFLAVFLIHTAFSLYLCENFLFLCGYLLLVGGGDEIRKTAHLAADCLGRLLADVVELGAAHLCAAHDINLVYERRVEREGLFDANTIGDLAHRKGRPGLHTVLAGDHETFKGLKTGLALFLNLLPNADRISRAHVKLGAIFGLHRRIYRHLVHSNSD